MEYPIHHISILINLLLIKGDQPKKRSGLKNILEIVEDHNEQTQDKLDDQFLYKLENRITESKQLNKTVIEVRKTTYIESCLAYLGYGDYDEFVEDIKKVERLISPLLKLNQQIILQIPESKKKRLKGLINRIDLKFLIEFYEDQSSSWSAKLNKEKPIIWFIAASVFRDQEDDLKKWFQENNTNTILSYWLTDTFSDMKPYENLIDQNSMLKGNEEHDDFYLLMQVIFNTTLSQNKRKKKKASKVTKISVKAKSNCGFLIGELKSKSAPQINNHYYGKSNDNS